MRFRDILLQIDSYPAATPDESIESAIGFAKVLDAELAVLAVQVDIPLSRNVVSEALFKLAGLEQEWEDASLASCRQAVRRFESAAKAAGVFAGAEIHRINLLKVDDSLALRVRARDLCLAAMAERFDEQIEWVKRIIFASGRPVVVMGGRPLLAEGRIGDVAVAWDGGSSPSSTRRRRPGRGSPPRRSGISRRTASRRPKTRSTPRAWGSARRSTPISPRSLPTCWSWALRDARPSLSS